jgi:hypothetical protein
VGNAEIEFMDFTLEGPVPTPLRRTNPTSSSRRKRPRRNEKQKSGKSSMILANFDYPESRWTSSSSSRATTNCGSARPLIRRFR